MLTNPAVYRSLFLFVPSAYFFIHLHDLKTLKTPDICNGFKLVSDGGDVVNLLFKTCFEFHLYKKTFVLN